jgi:predicted nucleic acid-binding protein
VKLVIADTGPVNYLILIDCIDLLPRLCETVVLPEVVQKELANECAPLPVRRWIASPPDWLQVMNTTEAAPLAGLHKGEAAAIELASVLTADLLLMDDRRGVLAAERTGIRVTGTLGVLDIAAERGMIDFAQAIRKLEKTTFRKPRLVLQALLEKHSTHLEP